MNEYDEKYELICAWMVAEILSDWGEIFDMYSVAYRIVTEIESANNFAFCVLRDSAEKWYRKKRN